MTLHLLHRHIVRFCSKCTLDMRCVLICHFIKILKMVSLWWPCYINWTLFWVLSANLSSPFSAGGRYVNLTIEWYLTYDKLTNGRAVYLGTIRIPMIIDRTSPNYVQLRSQFSSLNICQYLNIHCWCYVLYSILYILVWIVNFYLSTFP